MSDSNTPDEYVVEYLDGPLEGQTERRALIRGTFEDRVPAIVLDEGIETTFWYVEHSNREIDGVLHAAYRFDAPDSDDVVQDPDEESIEL